MVEYDFNNLDDYEFEVLCRDLINEEQRLFVRSNNQLKEKKILSFKSSKRGKDQGVDLYYEDERDNVIAQIKLSRGKFSELFSALKKLQNGKSEVDKVRIINPSKYILMTSVPLSRHNKIKLQEHFSPYILSINDIYGREDLNSLLGRLEHVERRHMKLYLSNPLVLERLINAATFKRSLFSLKQVQEDITNFVYTTNFSTSIEILKRENILIIKGLPGVGKTTLAKMLSLFYVEQEYQFIEIFDLDLELERIISTEGKIILYYDDFLGSNSLTIAEALRHDSKLSNLLRRIMTSSEKRLILTSRTNILSQPELHSEKLQKIFSTISKYEVDASNLNYFEKKQILLKHVEKNTIERIVSPKIYDSIISHTNFNPRLIESITEFIRQNSIVNVEQFIFNILDNPEEVWSFAYQKQSDYSCKIYLNHLFLFGNSCEIKKFQKSFENRMKFEAQINNYLVTYTEFKECTTLMDYFFIEVKTDFHSNIENLIKFINPSFIDFLLREIKNNTNLIANSVRSFDNIEILLGRFDHEKMELNKLLGISDVEDLLLRKKSFSFLNNNIEKMLYLKMCANYFSVHRIDALFHDEIISLINQETTNGTVDSYLSFALTFSTLRSVQQAIEVNFEEKVTTMLEQVIYKETFDDTIHLFTKFNYSIEKYTNTYDHYQLFYKTLEKVLEEEIENNTIFRNEYITSHYEVDEFYIDIKREYSDYLYKLNAPDHLLDKVLDSKDWNTMIEYYKFKNSGLEN
ncbi:MAG: AAA family ATPase [Flavobacterium sp.]|nr:MAG: AAA family ATPase [Flavobacterium sp.]